MHARTLIAACAAAILSTITIAGAATNAGATADAAAPQAKAPTWKVGDCYADAQVDADEVDLASKVACTKDHAVQIVAGEKLPPTLAAADLADLLSPTSSDREQVVKFAGEVCAPAAVARNIYPKQAKALAALFDEYAISEFIPPLAGRGGWVLPDAKSYDAGTKALLCVFQPDDTLTGTSAGDVRGVAKGETLETLRLCFDFTADNASSEFQTCDEVHDGESLIWLPLPLTSQPADVTTWTDADWAPFDEVCAKFATVLVGAERADLLIRADTDTALAPFDGNRVFNCRAYPEDETAAFPAGLNLNGIGKKKIAFAKT